MKRRMFLTLTAAGVVAATTTPSVPAAAGELRLPSGLLKNWFRATHRSLEMMTTSYGLPADNMDVSRSAPVLSGTTSPTNIGCWLWSTVAAAGLGVISKDEAARRLTKTVSAVESLKREHGFWFNWYNPRNGAVVTSWPGTGEVIRPFLSTVDNAWLVAGLRIAADAHSPLGPRIDSLLDGCDWSFFYTPYDAQDPAARPGQLRGGYWTDDGTFTGHHYGALNTEPRMASYLGIADGSLPIDHYWHLSRTLQPGAGQEQPPQGQDRTVDGVTYYNGHYTHGGRTFIPSWGGSMFEALMVPMLVPENEWSPSWRTTHGRYVRSQIEHGLNEAKYGFWGFSPCNIPEGNYQEYGVDSLGMAIDGYASNTDRTYTEHGRPLPPPSAFTNGVVTPHASFLALPYAESEAIGNLQALISKYPAAYSDTYGFRDSVNVGTGRVSDFVLALDQGMIAAALAQHLQPGLLQRPFRTSGFDSTVRPLLGREDFQL